MDYNEIYWKMLIACAALVALYFLVDKDDADGGN